MTNPYLGIEMIDLHPDERAELLRKRRMQLVQRKWKYERIIEQLACEFTIGKKHIASILAGKLPY